MECFLSMQSVKIVRWGTNVPFHLASLSMSCDLVCDLVYYDSYQPEHW